MNADPKRMVCALLSAEVFRAAGRLMLEDAFDPALPAVWLNHDIIAKRLAQKD